MGECPCHPSPSGLWAFSLLPLFRPKLLLQEAVLIFLQLCGRHRRRGEKRGKETVSVFARLLVLVVACWHSGVSNGLATVCHHCSWWRNGLCQLQPRSKSKIGRHLASYFAAVMHLSPAQMWVQVRKYPAQWAVAGGTFVQYFGTQRERDGGGPQIRGRWVAAGY